MSSRRQLMMVVAIVFAALAAASVYAFLGNATSKASANRQLVQVYVLNSDIAKLDPGTKVVDSLDLKKIPLGDLPEGRITKADNSRLSEFKNQVAAYNLRKGQILVDSMLVDQSLTQPASSYRVPKDMVAVSVSVDDVRGVGGNLQPGDYVNILSNFTPIADDPKTPWDDTKVPYTVTVYQKVKILYIGNTPAVIPGDKTQVGSGNGATAPAATPSSSGTITFEVPPAAASRIVNAANGTGGSGNGLTLTLVNPQYTPVDVPNIAGIYDLSGRATQQVVQNDVGKTPYPGDDAP